MYFQEAIETMPQDKLRNLQLRRLKRIANYCYERIPFYRDAFDEVGVIPEDIQSLEDLSRLPFTTKQDMRDAYPFSMFAVPREDVVRIHCSSGTTGTATVVGYTQNDLDNWADCFARGIHAIGGSKHDILQVCYGYGLFTGGLGAHDGGTRAGCTVLPMSTGNTDRQIRMMKDFGTNILCCTPSYALLIANRAIEMGFDPAHDFNISMGVCGAEPWSENMRHEIEQKMGMKIADIYGLSEIMGPGVATECIHQHGLHVNEDQFILEIVDPKTLQPVPDGEYGEVVFTTLTKECSPLIRYRTRDISRILTGECECGRTFRRMDRIQGRSDDMLIIRGVNVFPSQIEQVITNAPEVTPYYQIVLSNRGPLDHVQLLVEPVAEFPFDEIRKLEELKRRLSAELKKNLGVAVEIKIVEPMTIERAEGKAKRIIDNRGENA